MKRCSEKYAANQQENTHNAISIKLQNNGCSPVSLLHIFRTPFPENTSESPISNLNVDFGKGNHFLFVKRSRPYFIKSFRRESKPEPQQTLKMKNFKTIAIVNG